MQRAANPYVLEHSGHYCKESRTLRLAVAGRNNQTWLGKQNAESDNSNGYIRKEI